MFHYPVLIGPGITFMSEVYMVTMISIINNRG